MNDLRKTGWWKSLGLDGYFAAVAKIFGNRVTSALSGGYDSRLILAMLRRHGVAPHLFVYGNAGDQDVRLATAIARLRATRRWIWK